MNKLQKVLTGMLLTGLLLVATVTTTLAQSPLSASVDRTALTTDDVLTLTVVASGSGGTATQPELPDLDGFSFLGSSTSSQMSIVNGAMSSSVAYIYRLQPYATGTLTIEPITSTVDGQLYSTEPMAIEVSQGNGTSTQAPGASGQNQQAPSHLDNQEMFVEAFVGNSTPYVGEQITYTFRFYEALDAMRMSSLFMDQPAYNPPSLTGFWSEGEVENETYRVSLNGRIYTVTELRSHLFPTAAGEATIGPAQLTVPSFGFQRGGILQSEPVELTIQALPPGAPKSFSGAVGQFDLQIELDETETRLDEPVVATVTLSGWGNVGTAGDPVWSEATGWRTFNSDAQVETIIRDGRVGGIRTYEHTLIPVEAGELTLPPLEYSYFDPSAAEYRTLLREPGLVSVAPGPNGETSSKIAAEEPASTNAGTDLQQTALEPMPLPATLSSRGMPVTSQPWYWGLWALPVFTLAGSVVFQQRQAYRMRNADQIRRARARREAQQALAQLPAADDHTIITQSNRILIDFLAVRVGRPVGGSTSDELVALLEGCGVDPTLQKAVQRHLAAGEAACYSPGASATGETFCSDTDALIGQLDAVL